MNFIKHKCKKHFIMVLKSNRLVSLSEKDLLASKSQRIDSLKNIENYPVQCWISGIDFPVLIYSRVFKNKDESSGKLYLVCSDLDCDSDKINTIYKKRWKVELFHKTLKQNTAMAKLPAHTVCTQSNHLFIAIYSVFHPEIISIMTKLNHFALRFMIYINALKVAFQQIQQLTRCVT